MTFLFQVRTLVLDEKYIYISLFYSAYTVLLLQIQRSLQNLSRSSTLRDNRTLSLHGHFSQISISLVLKDEETLSRRMFSSSAEVLLCHLVHFHSAAGVVLLLFPAPPFFSKRSKECFCVDKRHVKMGPGDKTGFPISRSWTGKPSGSSLSR